MSEDVNKGMTFSQALDALKNGKLVKRAGRLLDDSL